MCIFQAYAAEAGPQNAEEPMEEAGMSDEIIQKVNNKTILHGSLGGNTSQEQRLPFDFLSTSKSDFYRSQMNTCHYLVLVLKLKGSSHN